VLNIIFTRGHTLDISADSLGDNAFLFGNKILYINLTCNIGYLGATVNFFLMALTVQGAVAKEEEKEARDLIKLSQTLRSLFLLAVAVIGYAVPVFNVIAVVIPFLFPRLAVTVRGLTMKK